MLLGWQGDIMSWEDIMKKDYVNVDEELQDLENQAEEYQRLALALGQIAKVAIQGHTYATIPEDKREVFDKAIAGMEEMEEQAEKAKKAYNDAIKNMAKLLGTENTAKDVKDFIQNNM